MLNPSICGHFFQQSFLCWMSFLVIKDVNQVTNEIMFIFFSEKINGQHGNSHGKRLAWTTKLFFFFAMN